MKREWNVRTPLRQETFSMLAPLGAAPNEHLRAIYSPAGGDGAADDGGGLGRSGRLFATAGFAVAASGFPDNHRDGGVARGQPGDYGIVGRRAIGTATGPHRRRSRNDFGQLLRDDQHHPAV